MWGKTRSEEYVAKHSAHVAPMVEHSAFSSEGKGLIESSAIMQFACNVGGLDQLYPPVSAPAQRAVVDSALAYHAGALYPHLARATYPSLGYPPSPGEAAHTAPELAAQAAKDAAAALEELFAVLLKDFVHPASGFIGTTECPSIADIRVVASMQFLPVIGYAMPPDLQAYHDKVVAALGASFTDVAGDVQSFVQSKLVPPAEIPAEV